MKAIIKVCTAAKEFTEDQKQIMRRVTNVLTEHNLSAAITIKVKKYKTLKIKAG
jgi:phage gpG-like protein